MSALRPYADALESWLARLTPVRAQMRALVQAVGHVAADDVIAPQPVPARAMALRDGYEMSSQAIAGASSYAPVVLTGAPRFVSAGEALSPEHVQQLREQLKALDIWMQVPELQQLQILPAVARTGLPVWQFRLEADLKVGR